MMGHGKDTQRFVGSLQVVGGILDAVYGGGYGGTGGGTYLIGSGIKNLSGSSSGTAAEGHRNKGFLTDLGLSLGAQGAAYGAGQLGGGGGGGLLGNLGGLFGGGSKGSSASPSAPPPPSLPTTGPPSIPGPGTYDQPRQDTGADPNAIDPTLVAALLARGRSGMMG